MSNSKAKAKEKEIMEDKKETLTQVSQTLTIGNKAKRTFR
jgi:hypothetical protein